MVDKRTWCNYLSCVPLIKDLSDLIKKWPKDMNSHCVKKEIYHLKRDSGNKSHYEYGCEKGKTQCHKELLYYIH